MRSDEDGDGPGGISGAGGDELEDDGGTEEWGDKSGEGLL